MTTFYTTPRKEKRKKPEPKNFRQTGLLFFKPEDKARSEPTQVTSDRIDGVPVITATHWDDQKSHDQEAADVIGEKREVMEKRLGAGKTFHRKVDPGRRIDYMESETLPTFKDERRGN